MRRYSSDEEYDSKQEKESIAKSTAAAKQKIADKNVQEALDLRCNKQKHTDFYFKLQELKSRIEIFNLVFSSKQPRYIEILNQKKVNISFM